MKLNHVITGCALAAGLMAFAPQSQASLVISNSVVSPINIKATVFYVTIKNKVQKVSFSNKDILNNLDLYYPSNPPKGAKLAYWEGDIVIISDKAIVDDLTADNVLINNGNTLDFNSTTNKSGINKCVEVGTTEFVYNSDGIEGIDNNTYGFDVTGNYTLMESKSAVKNGYQTDSVKFKTSVLTGTFYDASIGHDLPVTATESDSGSGKLLVVIQ